MAAAKHAPARPLAIPRDSGVAIKAEAVVMTAANANASRIVRTRPRLSETIPHTGCIRP